MYKYLTPTFPNSVTRRIPRQQYLLKKRQLFCVAAWLSGILSHLVNVKLPFPGSNPGRNILLFIWHEILYFSLEGFIETRVWKVRSHSSWFSAVSELSFSPKAQWNIFLYQKIPRLTTIRFNKSITSHQIPLCIARMITWNFPERDQDTFAMISSIS